MVIMMWPDHASADCSVLINVPFDNTESYNYKFCMYVCIYSTAVILIFCQLGTRTKKKKNPWIKSWPKAYVTVSSFIWFTRLSSKLWKREFLTLIDATESSKTDQRPFFFYLWASVHYLFHLTHPLLLVSLKLLKSGVSVPYDTLKKCLFNVMLSLLHFYAFNSF